MEEENVFKSLNAINVNSNTEKKQNLTYLCWAWAWKSVKDVYPKATYTIFKDDQNRPYIYDDSLGYMCFTTVTIEVETLEMWLPVMNGANKAMKDDPYTYQVKDWKTQQMVDKPVEQATMFDINKTIMRCLVKNLAMFGLGIYIYAGEDLPTDEDGKEIVKKPELSLDGFNYLISNGTSKEINIALDNRTMTDEQLKELKLKLK